MYRGNNDVEITFLEIVCTTNTAEDNDSSVCTTNKAEISQLKTKQSTAEYQPVYVACEKANNGKKKSFLNSVSNVDSNNGMPLIKFNIHFEYDSHTYLLIEQCV